MSEPISEFEYRVLEVLIINDPDESILRRQVKEITVTGRENTGVGLYVDFAVSENAPRLNVSHRYIEGTPLAHLSHPELPAGAGVMLWFKEGYISCLECYTYEGEWPKNLKQFIVEPNAIET